MKFAIMAGGTGGHIFPGLAVARALLEMRHEVIWLGSEGGMEVDLVGRANLPFFALKIKGLRGGGLLRKLRMPWQLLRATIAALRVLRSQRVNAVLSLGGYASAPGGLAARWAKIPLVVHEQNSVFGLTNRKLSRWASRVLSGFQLNGLYRSEWVGNPVRHDIEQTRHCLRDATPVRVLILGGSQGARSLNTQLPKALIDVRQHQPMDIVHQCGRGHVDETRAAHSGAPVEVHEFIDDMARMYAWADVCVCRAGALTVAEIAAVGLPALLVPYPHAVDDHQTGNAQQLVQAGAGLLWQERDGEAALRNQLHKLMAFDQRTRMHEALQSLRKTRVAETVANICCEVAR